MPEQRKYYTLVAALNEDDQMTPQFGDYERSVVAQEQRDSFQDWYESKIITTDDDQESINQAVALLNAKRSMF